MAFALALLPPANAVVVEKASTIVANRTFIFFLPFWINYGSRTLSMTWITPFEPTMSVAMTLDLLM